jgi:hypothetical protein
MIKFGSRFVVDAEDVNATVLQLLADITYNNTSPLILIGFDTYTEFEWISQTCPALAMYFTAWVDIQEITAQRTGVSSPGLVQTLNAIPILDRRPGTKPATQHHAANDAVRCLAVLFGLMCLESLTIPIKDSSIRLQGQIRPSYTCPFTARITTADKSILPLEIKTARSLADLFKTYNPIGVGINQSSHARSNGVMVWWLSFSTLDCLQHFATHIHGSILHVKKILVEGYIASQKEIRLLSTSKGEQ